MSTVSLPTEKQRSVRWTMALENLSPNAPAAGIAIVGLAGEACFAWKHAGHVLWLGGWASVLAAVFLCWFWVSAGWGGWLLATGLGKLFAGTSRSLRVPIQAVLLVNFVFAAVVYAISWGMFLQTGRFANWEAVRFTLANLDMLGEYFQDADAMQFAWLGLTVVLLMVMLPLLARTLTSHRWAAGDKSQQRRNRIVVWMMLLVGVNLAVSQVGSDASLSRRVIGTDRFRNCLNPILTLVSSGVESLRVEGIEACLGEGELVALGDTGPGTTRLAALTSDKKPLPAVIIVAVESLRHDVVGMVHQGREVAPNINRLARSGLHLTRAYSQSTHSDYADVCLVSSLYPLRTRHHHFYSKADPWPKTLLYDVLKPHGYATAIISSQNESWGGMEEFLETPALDYYYHPERSSAPTIVSERDPGYLRELRAGSLFAGSFPDRHTVDVALKWIEDQPDERPFFLAMTFQSSHFPYILPDDCPQPFQPCHLDEDVKFSSYPQEKTPMVRNAYYNAIAESDRQIGRLVEKLRQWGRLNNTIIVVTGENGEAFHENGAVGHAAEPVEPAVHIAAVVNAPGRVTPQVENYPFEHVDLAPTILGLCGLPAHPNFQGTNILDTQRPPSEQRLLFFHVLSPIAQADAVLCGGRWKYMLRKGAVGQLFDLINDPTESRDASAEHPERATELAGVLSEWRRRQLAYYHYPQYYGRFYPPQPPRLP